MSESSKTGRVQLVDWPCECPVCGSGVIYGTTESSRSIVFCKGDCGEWSYVYPGNEDEVKSDE